MFKTSHENKIVEVFTGAAQHRRRAPQEKITIVQKSMEPGMTAFYVAWLHGVNAHQVCKWCKQYQEGSLTAITTGKRKQ